MVVRGFLTSLILMACTVGEVPLGGGGTPDGGNDGTGGGQSFNAIVKPLVTECVGCHSSTHQNIPYLTAAEQTTVASWIDSL